MKAVLALADAATALLVWTRHHARSNLAKYRSMFVTK